MMMMISCLSPHNLHLLFCCILSIFTLNSWFLWHYFVLLLKRFSFSQSFPFLAMSRSFRVRFHLFVAWNIHLVVFLPIFPCYCCSVDLYIICVDRYNFSFFALFLCSLWVLVLMHPRCFQCWWILFLLLFFDTNCLSIVYLCHFLDVRPYTSSLTFLSSSPVDGVRPSSILRS